MIVKFKINLGKYIQTINVDLTNPSPQTYQLRFPYHPQLINEVKQFKGAHYIPPDEGGPVWNVAVCERNDYAIKYMQGWRDPRYLNSDMPTWEGREGLFDHQICAIDFILTRKHCMLAHEMGLGKTLSMIKVMEYAMTDGIFDWWLVAPLGAQREWMRQLCRWKAKVWPVEITTYESLRKLMDKADGPPQGVIFDECIRIKNPSAQRSQVASELCRLLRQNYPLGFIVGLSGAPAPKDPSDWWHQIECICPGFIREGNIHKFRNRYANIVTEVGEYGPYPVITGWKEDEVAKLGKRLAPIVQVRRKKDCLDLPEKIFDPIQCVLEENTENAINLLIKQATTAIEALTLLRELSDGFLYQTIKTNIIGRITPLESKGFDWIGSSKLDVLKELLDFYHTDNGGPGRLVVYACFHATIDYLTKWIPTFSWDVERIDGRGWSNENFLELFDSGIDDNLCLVANPACVHGISLQRTQAFIYYSNSFSVDHRIQSLDRRDRPGMDTTKATRIVDILNLPVDKLILDRLNSGIDLQGITLEEIKKCMNV